MPLLIYVMEITTPASIASKNSTRAYKLAMLNFISIL